MSSAEEVDREGLENARRIERMLLRLMIEGRQTAYGIVKTLGRTEGVMPCPMCQQALTFHTDSCGCVRFQCSTPHCIDPRI